MTHEPPDGYSVAEITERERKLGAPFIESPEGEPIMDGYIRLVMTVDLAKDTLSDESAPEGAKLLAQAILGISQALGLQRLRALDDLSTN